MLFGFLLRPPEPAPAFHAEEGFASLILPAVGLDIAVGVGLSGEDHGEAAFVAGMGNDFGRVTLAFTAPDTWVIFEADVDTNCLRR